MQYIDQKTRIRALAVGIAVGAGMFVVMDNPAGIGFGVLIAAGVIVGGYVQNRKNTES